MSFDIFTPDPEPPRRPQLREAVVAAGSRRAARRRSLTTTLAAVAIVAVALPFAVRSTSDNREKPDGRSASPPTFVTGSTLVPSASPFVWPSPCDSRFDDPVAAAGSFATEFVGFVEPVLSQFRSTGEHQGEVEIRPVDGGPATTATVWESGTGGWCVVGASAASLEVSVPQSGSAGSPTRVSARTTLTVPIRAEIRADGADEPIGRGVLNRYDKADGSAVVWGELQRTGSSALGGAIVLTAPAPDGSTKVWVATVIRVELRSGATTFSCETPATTTTTGIVSTPPTVVPCWADPEAATPSLAPPTPPAPTTTHPCQRTSAPPSPSNPPPTTIPCWAQQ